MKNRDLGLVVGVVIVGAVALVAILAPLIAPYDPIQEFGAGLGGPIGPDAMFPLGTDGQGRDELSRLVFGARTSLIVGFGAGFIAMVAGTTAGLLAAFLGDRTAVLVVAGRRLTISIAYESVLMRLADAAFSFPVLLFAILLYTTLGASLALTIGLIASVAWARTARVIYAASLPVVSSDYIVAARATGVGERRIVTRHVLPHVLPLAVVMGSLTVAGAILVEASLSFLAVSGASTSWGRMLADDLGFMDSQPRLLLLPGLAIALTVLGFTLLADSLGERLDPRRRHTTVHADAARVLSMRDAT
jgi:peptide/nickel transport system permease protein